MKRALLLLALVGCADVGAQPDAVTTTTASAAFRNATRVEVAVITASAAALELKLPGEVEAWRDAQLASSLGGYVEAVYVKSGNKVRKGQMLARIDSATHIARRNQAKVELDTAKTELKRAKRLGKTLPKAQLDAAQARVNAAKAAYASADVMVNRSVILAPFAGVVAKVDIEVGEVAGPGMPVIRVMQVDPVKVTVSLSDRDVLSVSKGMKAMVGTDARGQLRVGKVAHIHPAADMKTRAFMAEVKVPNKDGRLLPGMIATVHLKADVAAKKVVISQDWLVTKTDALGVFVHKDGKAEWRDVKVGPIVRDTCVIDSGLQSGDELIVAGHRELAPDDPLMVARRGQCCTNGRVVFP